jgi:hypothetical protein
MENRILERLSAIVATGQLDLPSYFKQCAILGVTFTAAAASVAGTEAWARADAEKPFASRQYTDFIPPDVVKLFSAPAVDLYSVSTVVAQQSPWSGKVSSGTWSGAQASPPWSGKAPPWSGKVSWSGLQSQIKPNWDGR